MAPFYADMCAELEKTPDKKILSDLKAKNKAHLKKLDDKIEAAGQVEGIISKNVLIESTFAFRRCQHWCARCHDRKGDLFLSNRGQRRSSCALQQRLDRALMKKLMIFSSRSRKERYARNPTRPDVRYSPNRPFLQRQEANHWKCRKSKENDRRRRGLGSTKQTEGLRRPLLHYCQRFQVSEIFSLFLWRKRPLKGTPKFDAKLLVKNKKLRSVYSKLGVPLLDSLHSIISSFWWNQSDNLSANFLSKDN